MKVSLRKTSISYMGIFLFLLAMYSIGTISATTASWTCTLMLMVMSVGLVIIIHPLQRVHFCSTAIIWAILTMFCGIGVLRGSNSTVFFFYILCLILLCFGESVRVGSLFRCLKWFIAFGLIFAFGCYWQLLFPEQYYSRLYPLFAASYQQSIRRQFTFNKMCTGFTFQTSNSAQFIILGIMAVIYIYAQKDKRWEKIISIIEMIFLSGGLLLTGKRSPLLSIGVAIILVDRFTVERSKKGKRILAVALGLIVAFTVFYFLAPMFSGSRNTIVRLMEYADTRDIDEVTNGRLSLSVNAITQFKRHPVLGIGWGNYSRLYNMTGTHNIYLQLLCECGIFGFIIAVFGMLYAMFRTIKMLKSGSLVMNEPVAILLKCSLFIQIYTMVYGFFGNPIYDQNYLLMYCIGILFSVSVHFSQRAHIQRNSNLIGSV